jgi:CRISPR-associated exonuclease Cas4
MNREIDKLQPESASQYGAERQRLSPDALHAADPLPVGRSEVLAPGPEQASGRAGTPHAAVPLTVTDLKQWVYCQRIPYYHHVMPVEFVRTYKMQRGRDIEAAVAAMEERRGWRRYGLEQGERRFGVSLHSAAMNLTGKLDLLLVAESGCYPVDFKDTEGGVRENHRFQLAAYAMLVEENLGRPVPRAFIYLVPTRQLVSVTVGRKEKDTVERAMAAIRRMIEREEMPEPTPARARCTGCEFRNYCGDIW